MENCLFLTGEWGKFVDRWLVEATDALLLRSSVGVSEGNTVSFGSLSVEDTLFECSPLLTIAAKCSKKELWCK